MSLRVGNQTRTSPSPPRHSRRNHWRGRRKIAIGIVILILCIPLVGAGWYVHAITDAIGDAQEHAVVDLPTRQSSISGDRQPDEDTSNRAPDQGRSGGPSSFDVARGLISAGTGGQSTSPQHIWPNTHYLNVLVLGIDTRDDGGDQNADVIIIAQLDLQQKSLRSVSIPRDLLVDIPGVGPGKINGAYGAGIEAHPDDRAAGVAKMRDTIEHNFNIPINDYILIDFDGFKEVVDSVGGIDIDVPEKIVDDAYPTEDYGTRTLIIEAGPQHMDGETALAYARTRHADSDDERRERQMLVIRAIFDKGKRLGTVTKVADIISAAGGAVQTNFHWDEQLALASIALDMHNDDIDMRTLEQPLIQPGTTEDGAWVYIGDPDEIGSFIESSFAGGAP